MKTTNIVSTKEGQLTRVTVQPNLKFRPELFPNAEDELSTARTPINIDEEATKEAESLIASMYAELKEASAPRHRYKLPLDTDHHQQATRMKLSTRPISHKPWSPEREVCATRVLEGKETDKRQGAATKITRTICSARVSQQRPSSASVPPSFAAWIPSGSKFLAKQETKTMVSQQPETKAIDPKPRKESTHHQTVKVKRQTIRQQPETNDAVGSNQPIIECEEENVSNPPPRLPVTGLKRQAFPSLPPAFNSFTFKEDVLSREQVKEEVIEPSAPPETDHDEVEIDEEEFEPANELPTSQSEFIYIPSSLEHCSPSKGQSQDKDEDDNEIDLGPQSSHIIIVQSPHSTPSKAKKSPAKQPKTHPPSPSVIVLTHSPCKPYISDYLPQASRAESQAKEIPIVVKKAALANQPDNMDEKSTKRASSQPPLDHYSKLFASMIDLDPLLWPSPHHQSPEKAVQTEPLSPASSSYSIDSVADLAELEALVEKQHRQLISRGLLPPDAKLRIPRSPPPRSVLSGPPPRSVLSGGSWESYELGVQRLGDGGFSFD